MRRRGLALGLAILVLTATGCGTSEEARFRTESLRPVVERIEKDKAQLSAQLQVARLGSGPDSRVIGELVSRLSGSVDLLAGLPAPESLTGEFSAYVKAHRRLVRELRQFAELLGGDSEKALNRQATAAQSAAGEIARARNALDAKLVAAK